MKDTDEILPFTGERFTPESVREIWYEHWHRYAFAQQFVAGKRVLDAACGEGYGSALLARTAAEVVGMDIDGAAIEHARRRYGSIRNVAFSCADVTAIDAEAGSFDVVVSFETLEHLQAHDALLAGFVRLLGDDGVLLISSPDKATYSDAAGFHNPFHVRELYRDEFEQLLNAHFPHVALYGQKLVFHSALWSLDRTATNCEVITASDRGTVLDDGFRQAPVYFLAVCSKRPLREPLPSVSLFGDAEESVYAHYNHEVKKNIAAGARIAELEAEVERLRGDHGVTAKTASNAAAAGRWWQRRRPRA